MQGQKTARPAAGQCRGVVYTAYFTLNTARSSQLSALGHLTTTICMAHTSLFDRVCHCMPQAGDASLQGGHAPLSARVSTTRPLPPVQARCACGAVNSLLTPSGKSGVSVAAQSG